MDINQLASIVKELLLEQDTVAVSGMGVFRAFLVPASFSDRGYTVNPPDRQLVFDNDAEVSDDGLCAAYAGSEGISEEDAREELERCVSEIREMLESFLSVELPGLGKLRLTREGSLFFVSDPELDIYPEGFGLASVSLKNRQVQKSAKAPLAGNDARAAETPETEAPEPEKPATPEEQERETVTLPDEPSEKKKRLPVWLRVLIAVVALTLVLAVALRLLGTFAPDFLDKVLYTPQELDMIHGGQ